MFLLDEIRFQEPSWFWISEGQSEAVPGGWCPCLLDLLPSLISAFLLQVSLQVQPLHGFAPTLSFPQREGQGRVTAFKRAIEKNSLKSWKLEMCQNSTHRGLIKQETNTIPECLFQVPWSPGGRRKRWLFPRRKSRRREG